MQGRSASGVRLNRLGGDPLPREFVQRVLPGDRTQCLALRGVNDRPLESRGQRCGIAGRDENSLARESAGDCSDRRRYDATTVGHGKYKTAALASLEEGQNDLCRRRCGEMDRLVRKMAV